LPEREALGLLALMLLHESRRASRTTLGGDLVPLEEQDRSAWNAELIREGCMLTERALSAGLAGPYALQAAISAVHAEAARWEQTDWAQIKGLYDALLRVEPSPVVELNRAVAVAMHDGLEAGFKLVDSLLARGELTDYHLAHATRADLCRRLGRHAEAREAYSRALALTQQAPERRLLAGRLAALDGAVQPHSSE
jgi:RNA polymerase sigma-70 factor (ECF subfamily)